MCDVSQFSAVTVLSQLKAFSIIQCVKYLKFRNRYACSELRSWLKSDTCPCSIINPGSLSTYRLCVHLGVHS